MYLSEVVSAIYTITLVCKFSYCFLYISCDSYKDDFSNKQELLEFIIISFILTGDTVRRNQMLIFLREYRVSNWVMLYHCCYCQLLLCLNCMICRCENFFRLDPLEARSIAK